MSVNKFGQNKKVLIVDDEEDLRIAMCCDFEKRGFTVFTSANGNEAITVLKSEQIDVVISDIQMPVCDGICLLKKSKLMQLDNAFFLLMSGFSNYTNEQLVGFGANALISKPINRKEMFRIIEEALTF